MKKNTSEIQETPVRFLDGKDPLKKGKAPHSSILAGEFHGLYRPWGGKESDTTEQRSLSLSIYNVENIPEAKIKNRRDIISFIFSLEFYIKASTKVNERQYRKCGEG